MYLDYTMLLLLPGIIITAIAQSRINSTYHKYSKVPSSQGKQAWQVAREMLDSHGLQHVAVERVRGSLTDHYDPTRKVLRLSDSIYGSTSVAALGVAAHECGHALQDAEGYAPLKFRGALVPVANIGSKGSWILILLGIFLGMTNLVGIGILLFSAVVLFQLVTLPVEFNASNRALAVLGGVGYLSANEVPMAKKVLKAAALTYVAAALTSILQLLRLLLIFGNRRD